MGKKERKPDRPAEPRDSPSGSTNWKLYAGVAVAVVLVAMLFQSSLNRPAPAAGAGKGKAAGSKGHATSSATSTKAPAGSPAAQRAESDANIGPGILPAEREEFLARMKRKLIHSSAPTPYHGHVPSSSIWNVNGPLADSIRRYNATVMNEEPLLVVLDNFLTAAECELMIDWAWRSGLQRSVLAGDYTGGKFDRPISDIRTSQNAWCYDDCFNDPRVREVDMKISALTHKDWKNGELFQLLRYEPGQYYAQHTDFIDAQRLETSGIRVMTVFLYLNDGVEGGETFFPRINVSVTPRMGRVVMWPNVLPGSEEVDLRTEHLAMPVLKGVKYAANKWIHQNDFITLWSVGRTG
eukprot:c15468_g1_i2.p1 GENE.c15468_g1_i2~~c15468_g1_i2.p1  ORF type:complete len:365 (+),score=69.06 c15468_g1_i2:40-1095(+)